MKSQLYTDFMRGVRRCSRRKDKSPFVTADSITSAHVVRELIESERTYLSFLQRIVEHFLKPMEEENVISRSECHILFGEIEAIHSINSVLLNNLESIDLLKAFIDFLPFTKLYCRYAEKFQRAQKLHLSKLKTDRRYQKVISATEIQVGIKCDALLIMPIQRIPRYILLLSKLRDTHSMAVDVADVVRKLELLTRQIDAHVVESKHTSDLLEVEKKLDFLDELMLPGRKLLKSGILYEVSARSRFKKHVWLFSDIFVAGTKKVNGHYDCSFVLPVRHCEITSDFSNFSFTIRCREQTVTMTSDSYGISQAWILSIELTISQARACRSTLRKESSKQRPWKRRETFAQRVRSISTKGETNVTSETSSSFSHTRINKRIADQRDARSSLLSCFSCLGKRGKRLTPPRPTDNHRISTRPVLRVEKNVPWWVTESTAS